MSFLLPSTYTLSDAPQPSDQRIKLKNVPPLVVAVKKFTWK